MLRSKLSMAILLSPFSQPDNCCAMKGFKLCLDSSIALPIAPFIGDHQLGKDFSILLAQPDMTSALHVKTWWSMAWHRET